MGGDHLQAGEILETFVHDGPDPPASGEVELGQQAEIVDRERAVVPDDQAPSLHWDVLQATDGMFVPQLQVIFPQCSRVPTETLSFLYKDKSTKHT